jgi:hypothetical protein
MTDDVWLSQEEAADYLGVSLIYYRYVVRKRGLPIELRDDQEGLLVSDLKRLLEMQRIVPGTLYQSRDSVP